MTHCVEQGIATNLDKIAIIIVLPIPTTVTDIKGFLGHTGYYIAMPLTKLLKKGDEAPLWTSTYTHAFNTLKRKLVFAPILIPLD